ncbi:MAG: alanine racemase [Gemmatimonadetes bacterium]|nr:alanine racemase [Gemmatimonadota bacterium]
MALSRGHDPEGSSRVGLSLGIDLFFQAMNPSNQGEDPTRYGRAWVEINPAALQTNLDAVRDSVGPDVRVVPMVKADAYGLGVEQAVAILEGSAPSAYGVATVDEGVQLLALGIERPVMVYSPVPPGQVRQGVEQGLVLSVSSAAEAEAVGRAASGPAAPVQVEIDTGMGRAGLPAHEVGTWWPALRDDPRLSVVGVWTHLHSADEADLASGRAQIALFEEACGRLDGLDPGALIHVANSAGSLRLACSGANAVRPGYFLYGGHVGEGTPPPEAVVSLRARVALVREVAEGTTLGYGATYRAGGTERWASVAIGYGDGLPWALGNRGRALVRGRSVPIIGRISMDSTVVDVSDLDALAAGEAVTFIGSDGGAHIALDEVARVAGTIGYEILTGLSPRLPRVWDPLP